MTLAFALLLCMGSQQHHQPKLKCLPPGEKCRVVFDANIYETGVDPALATFGTTSAPVLDLRNHYKNLTIMPGALDAAPEPPNPPKDAIVCWEDADQFIHCKDSQGKNRTRPTDESGAKHLH